MGALYKITNRGQIRPCILYKIQTSNPIFFPSTFSCCTKFLALQNQNPGPDPHKLTMSDPSMLARVCAPKKQLLDFVEAGGCVQLKLSETMEKSMKKKNQRMTKSFKHIKTKECWPNIFCHMIYTNRCCWFFGLKRNSSKSAHDRPPTRISQWIAFTNLYCIFLFVAFLSVAATYYPIAHVFSFSWCFSVCGARDWPLRKKIKGILHQT